MSTPPDRASAPEHAVRLTILVDGSDEALALLRDAASLVLAEALPGACWTVEATHGLGLLVRHDASACDSGCSAGTEAQAYSLPEVLRLLLISRLRLPVATPTALEEGLRA